MRQGSKTKTAIRLITQAIEELKRARIAGAMGNNASTLMLRYNKKASSSKEQGKFLGLSDLELEKYASLQQGGYRAVLIKAMNAAHVWRVAVSPWAHALLSLMNGTGSRSAWKQRAMLSGAFGLGSRKRRGRAIACLVLRTALSYGLGAHAGERGTSGDACVRLQRFESVAQSPVLLAGICAILQPVLP